MPHLRLILTLLFSILLHAGLLFWLVLNDIEAATEIAPQMGRVSVRVSPSQEARREHTKEVEKVRTRPHEVSPPELQAFPILATEVPEALLQTFTNPQPAPAEPAQPLPDPQKRPEPPARVSKSNDEPRVNDKDTTKRVAKTESIASLPSQASEGAVDQVPQLLVNPAPIYPPDAVAAGQEGSVRLLITIGASGRIVAASIADSSGVASLDESALSAIRRWVFNPAMQNGKPVAYKCLKRFDFAIRR